MTVEKPAERLVEVKINPNRIKALLVIQDKTGIPVSELIDIALSGLIQKNQELFINPEEQTKKEQ